MTDKGSKCASSFLAYPQIRKLRCDFVLLQAVTMCTDSRIGLHGLHLHFGDLIVGSVSTLITNIRPTEMYNLAAQSHVQVTFELPCYTGGVGGQVRTSSLIYLSMLPETASCYATLRLCCAGRAECLESSQIRWHVTRDSSISSFHVRAVRQGRRGEQFRSLGAVKEPNSYHIQYNQVYQQCA